MYKYINRGEWGHKAQDANFHKVVAIFARQKFLMEILLLLRDFLREGDREQSASREIGEILLKSPFNFYFPQSKTSF